MPKFKNTGKIKQEGYWRDAP